MGEGGQQFHAGLAGKPGGCSTSAGPIGQRELPAHGCGCCAAGHWLPGLLWGHQGEQVYAADGEPCLKGHVQLIKYNNYNDKD